MLASADLSARVRRDPEGFALCVPVHEADRALEVLSAYESENSEPRRDPEPTAGGNGYAALAVSAALLAFFLLTGPRSDTGVWFERGSADARAILQGELWRTVTALTLHADRGHVLANAIFGALFLGAVCTSLGAGVGFALVLLAGAGGNLLNALFQGSHHVSVGASTAVFGAVGLLSGLSVARRRRRSQGRPWWVPMGAGLALLAMLGTTGERVDLWAHLLGLLVGVALGVPAGFAFPIPPRAAVQWLFGSGAFLVIAYSWTFALG